VLFLFRMLGALWKLLARFVARLLGLERGRYRYKHIGKLVFVEDPPDREFAYRKEPDGKTGRTWQQITRGKMLDALEDLATHAGEVAGWPLHFLESGFAIARRMMNALDGLLPRKENFTRLRLGQRLTTAIVKIAFARRRVPQAQDYLRAGIELHGAPPSNALLTDRTFAYLRVAGMNPTLLRCARTDGDLAACGELATIRTYLGDATLVAARDAGRLYVIPPEAFALLRNTLHAGRACEHPHRCHFLGYPTAVFIRPEGERDLLPVCIRFGEDFETIVPTDRRWESAKVHYGVAECIHHTFARHLPQTHFVVEPIVIATRRKLVSREHPIYRLLEPHLVGTNAVNWVARNTIPPDSSPFSDFVGSDVWSTFKLCGDAFEAAARAFLPVYNGHDFPADDLRYPWRDDSAAVEAQLRWWVESFVALHYPSDKDVVSDERLQQWGAEIRHRRKGRLEGFPFLDSIEALQTALTTIIVHATIQHAAFHFSQTDLGRLAILNPFCATDVVPGRPGSAQRPAISGLATLPDLHAAAWQSFILGQTVIRWRTLTEHNERFEDDRERALADRLHDALANVERDIERRNAELVADGLLPYEYLKPSNVPCSINA
jgi:arachidonate 15-lipoxygenase